MEGINSETFGLMQANTPYKSYIKTVLGKLYVNVLNPFDLKPEGRIIEGDPKKVEDGCILDVWSEMEDVYLKRTNKRHFETGNLLEYTRKPKEESPKGVHEYSDEELKKLLNSKFFTLQNTVNGLDSIAPVFRLLSLAREEEKSEKIIKFLEGKLSELQLAEYPQPEVEEEAE